VPVGDNRQCGSPAAVRMATHYTVAGTSTRVAMVLRKIGHWHRSFHWLLAGTAIGLMAATPRAQGVRQLTAAVPIERELSTGQVHTYRLTLDRGDFVRITIEQRGIDVAAALIDPHGREVAATDAMDDEYRPEIIVAIADVAGTFTATARPTARTGARGHYAIHVESPRPAAASDETRVEAERAFARGRARRDVNKASTWPEALADFKAARDHYRAVTDRPGEMKSLIEIAVTENYMSRPEALEAAEHAERLAREIGDRAALARTLRVSGSILVLAGNLDAAARSVEEATDINRAIGNRVAESHSLNYTAIIYRRLGDVEKAIALYERTLPLARATNGRALEASILNNLGNAYKSLGEYDKALSFYEQSLAHVQTANDPRAQSTALGNLANLRRELGDHAKARALLFQVLEIERKIGDRQREVSLLNGVGLTYFSAGEYARALEQLLEAVTLGRQFGDVSGQAWALAAAGRALPRLGRADESVAALQESVTIHRQTRERFGERDALSDLARVERDRGNLAEALAYIQQSVDLDEATRAEITSPELRTAFVAAEQNKYEMLIDVLQRRHRLDASSGYDAAALEVSERARARVLLDSLLDTHVDLREGISPTLLDRERLLQKQINDASSNLSRLFGSRSGDEPIAAAAYKVDRLTAEYHQLQAQIRQESPHYASVTQPQPLSAGEIQQSVVDEDTVLLEFALGEERSWLWAVTPHSVKSVELPARETIEAEARVR
jgi:tetratricopeptide (TPR) repeat protein